MTPELQSKLLRWGGTFATIALVALNKKLGLDLTTADITVIAGIIIGAVTGSNLKEASGVKHDANVQIATINAAPPTLDAAMAVVAAAPDPTKVQP